MTGAQARTVVLIALRQLWARKGLNGIAIGGVTLGVLVLIAMSGILSGLEQKFFDSILKISPHIIVYDTELVPEPPLLVRYEGGYVAADISHESPSERQTRIKNPSQILSALDHMKGVAAAAPSLQGMVLVEFGGKTKSLDLRGVDPVAQERVTPLEGYMRQGTFSALSIAGDGLVVGSGVASELGLEVGDVVHAAAPGGRPLDLEVVGIFEAEIPPVDKVRGYCLLRDLQTLLGHPDTIRRIEVRLEQPETASEAAVRMERAFGYDAESWQETNSNFLAIFALQAVVTNFVIAAILVVGGFSILAIQIMIVLQKTRDIAILRSIGLERSDILRIFMLQGVIVALIGGVLGDGLGKAALYFLGKVKIHLEGLVKSDTLLVFEDVRFYAYGLAFALVVGLTASLIPAWRGSRVEPVDVLRGQIG
jgi:lipoprotein-releasing system permease protein